MRKHLAIFDKNTLSRILDGKKTIDSRFSLRKLPPFGQINKGDLIYIKESGGEIKGQFLVQKIIQIEGLEEADLEIIKKNYAQALSLGSKDESEKYFNAHKNSKYATLIFISRVERYITSPVRIPKKDLRGWVVL